MSSSPRDVIGPVLPKSWSQTKRDDLADQIADALYEAGLLVDEGIDSVEVRNARVTVETVEAYGLTIAVDAHGNAVQVTSPWGLEIAA